MGKKNFLGGNVGGGRVGRGKTKKNFLRGVVVGGLVGLKKKNFLGLRPNFGWRGGNFLGKPPKPLLG